MLARLAQELFTHTPSSLRLLLADALRARGRYGEALTALGESDAPAARAQRGELLRLLGRREEAMAAVSGAVDAAEGSVRFAALATAARLALDRGEVAASLASATSAAWVAP